MTRILLPALLGLAALAAVAGCADDRFSEVVDVAPGALVVPAGADSRTRNEATLATLRTVDGLHAMAFGGDFSAAVDFQHRQIMDVFEREGRGGGPRRGCSMFVRRTAPGAVLVGRNYDNDPTGVLAGWFAPEDGYASVALLPLKDLGFTPDDPFAPERPQHVRNLLYAPVMAIEGMNEMGVSVMLAGLERKPVTQDPAKPSRFLIHLVREILDRAASVHEAVGIAERYNVFDNGPQTISHHLLLADPHSGSAVLEWHDGNMHLVKDPGAWQVVTNGDMHGVSPQDRIRGCDRYAALADEMHRADTDTAWAWRDALQSLRRARQAEHTVRIDGHELRVATRWSAVFDTTRREILLVLEGDDRRVYRLQVGG